MEEEIKEKVCARCKKSIPATDEFWYPDKKTKDGFSYWCKACHRASKKVIKSKSKKRDYKEEYKKREKATIEMPLKKPPKNRGKDILQYAPTITATPEEIIKALRKGIAQEIIATIQEQFA